jgi:hypothetical protein
LQSPSRFGTILSLGTWLRLVSRQNRPNKPLNRSRRLGRVTSFKRLGGGPVSFVVRPTDCFLNLPAGDSSMADRLNPDERLAPDERLKSSDGRYTFIHQTDGNLVLYGPDGKPKWHSNTYGRKTDTAIMQTDGNFVLYGPDGALWNTGTWNHPGAYLILQDDGNLVIYEQQKAIWHTNTFEPPPPAPGSHCVRVYIANLGGGYSLAYSKSHTSAAAAASDGMQKVYYFKSQGFDAFSQVSEGSC